MLILNSGLIEQWRVIEQQAQRTEFPGNHFVAAVAPVLVATVMTTIIEQTTGKPGRAKNKRAAVAEGRGHEARWNNHAAAKREDRDADKRSDRIAPGSAYHLIISFVAFI
jgi:hypothetical protein